MTTPATDVAVHPARTAVAAPAPLARERLVRAYVWEAPVRITHWLIAGSILVLAATGYYIGRPFIVVPGEARFAFVTGTVKIVHSYAAIVFTLAVAARLLWMFLGNRWASWRELVPIERHRLRGLLPTVAFYTFLRREPPPAVGHNPLAGATYVAVFGLYLLEIATGFALYATSAAHDSPMRAFAFLMPLLGGAQMARWVHHVAMWLLLGFAVHHVCSALLMAGVERNGVMDSIFSGYKFVRRTDLERVREEGE